MEPIIHTNHISIHLIIPIFVAVLNLKYHIIMRLKKVCGKINCGWCYKIVNNLEEDNV